MASRQSPVWAPQMKPTCWEFSPLSRVLSGPEYATVCLLQDPVCLLQDLVRNQMVDANGANSEAPGGPRGSSRLQRGGSLQKLGAPRKPRPSGQRTVLCNLLGACSPVAGKSWIRPPEGEGLVACCRGVPGPSCSIDSVCHIAAVEDMLPFQGCLRYCVCSGKH